MNWQHVTIDWRLFFPYGTCVLALPNWQNPRLLVSAQHFSDRWRSSSLYPAYRLRAQPYKTFLRVKSAARLGEERTVLTRDWQLGRFIEDVLPGATAAAVYVGPNGPAQKMTVRLQDQNGRVAGYLKYGEREAARNRLFEERKLLYGLQNKLVAESSSRELAPKPIKHGSLGRGEALLTTLLLGKRLPARLTPPKDVEHFSRALVVNAPVSLNDHPWVRRIRERSGPQHDRYLEALAGKDWPIVIQHGDFTPFNMLRKPDGTIAAIDWEYGSLQGFPYLDLAYHILQTSFLIYRWRPSRATEHAVRYLIRKPWPGLERKEAEALTRLTAYDAYSKGEDDGKVPYGFFITHKWQRQIWEERE